MKIKKIAYISLGKVCAVFGFFAGIFYGLQLLAISSILTGNLSGLGTIISMTAGAAVIGGLIAGFIIGLLAAFIYNQIVARVGGLEFETD